MLNSWQKIYFDRKKKQEGFSEDFDEIKITPISLKDNSSAKYKSKTEAESQKLDKLVSSSSTVIFSAKTVFPFTFFPNEIVITLADVSVVYTEFLSSKQLRSVPISKIAEVIVETGFMFAKLKLVDKEFSQMSIEVDYLSLKDAMRAKRLIQGLMVAVKENIDLVQIKDEHLEEKIEEIGRVQGEDIDKD